MLNLFLVHMAYYSVIVVGTSEEEARSILEIRDSETKISLIGHALEGARAGILVKIRTDCSH